MPIPFLAFVFAILSLPVALPARAQAPDDLKIQDGIVASLSVRDAEARAIWRFVRPLDAPVDEISGTINGRPLGVPAVERYPGPKQQTAVLALLDLADPQRAEQIERHKLAMLLLAGRKLSHHQIAFAVYGLEARILLPGSGSGEEMIRLLLQLPPLQQESNLSGALIHSIKMLENLRVDRRAIYVFTDGHNDSQIAIEEVAKLAQSAGVSVTFLTIQGQRKTDLPALARFANSTGGLLVEEAAVTSFLREPFTLLDSGGQVRFSLAGVKTYFWEFGKPKLTVSFRYGGKSLDLSTEVSVPSASIGEGFGYLGTSPVFLGGVGGAFALVVLAVFLRRRKRPAVERGAAKGAPILGGILQEEVSGKGHVIDAPVMQIGRSRTNDIVIDDPTVSRQHAILTRADNGILSIENKSDRALLVNDERVDKTNLEDGDLVALGTVKLRFRQVKSVKG
jgi:hypothetical protein